MGSEQVYAKLNPAMGKNRDLLWQTEDVDEADKQRKLAGHPVYPNYFRLSAFVLPPWPHALQSVLTVLFHALATVIPSILVSFWPLYVCHVVVKDSINTPGTISGASLRLEEKEGRRAYDERSG